MSGASALFWGAYFSLLPVAYHLLMAPSLLFRLQQITFLNPPTVVETRYQGMGLVQIEARLVNRTHIRVSAWHRMVGWSIGKRVYCVLSKAWTTF
jgi:hypothetical protein